MFSSQFAKGDLIFYYYKLPGEKGKALFRGRLATHPPNPLPLLREGGVELGEGFHPSPKSLPPLLFKERGLKGVRLINNLLVPAIGLPRGII